MSIAIIKAFSGQKPIVIYPVYLDITGDYATAAALGQVLYWHEVMRGKFYKTDADFEQELHLTHRQFKRVKTSLKTLSFLKITLEQVPAKTFWDVDYEALTALIESITSKKEPPTGQYQNVPTGQYQNVPTGQYQNVPTGQYQNVPTITENTTEITKNYNNTPDPQNAALTQQLVGLTERQKEIVGEDLAKLTPEQQNIAVQSFNITVSSGKVNSSPMALMSGLIKKGLRNELEPIKATQTAQAMQSPATAQNKQNSRLEVIKHYVTTKKADLLKEFERGRYVLINGVGVVYKDDLKLAGLFD